MPGPTKKGPRALGNRVRQSRVTTPSSKLPLNQSSLPTHPFLSTFHTPARPAIPTHCMPNLPLLPAPCLPAPTQIAFTELEEGRVYLGMVTDVWLYHGVQVDIGAEFDG